jgi:hypothetical protein
MSEEDVMGEPETRDDAPVEETGHAEPDPQTAGEIAGDALGGEEVESVDQTVVAGADSTIIDPILDRMSKDERFKGHTFKSGEEALEAFANARAAVGRFDEDRRLGREARADWAEFQDYRRKQEEARKKEDETPPPWAPPPLPVGLEQELAKPEAERDPKKVQEAAAHYTYVQDKWNQWTRDPNAFVREMVLPNVDRIVTERMNMQTRQGELRTALQPDEKFIEANGAEIKAEMDAGLPLLKAVEMVKLRHKGKQTDAEDAKEQDVSRLEEGSPPGPKHAEVVPEGDAPSDARAIITGLVREKGLPL